MWMWAVSVSSPATACHCHPPICRQPWLRPPPPLGLAVYANPHPPPGQDVGGLGHTILTANDSNTKPTIPIPKPEEEEEEEEEGRQISGSDVLWAMQKAAAHKKSKSKKKMMNKNRKGSSSSPGTQGEVASMDHSNVRPLCIRNDWGGRLDELEKRLHQLSETK